jgi:hypothetical protein
LRGAELWIPIYVGKIKGVVLEKHCGYWGKAESALRVPIRRKRRTQERFALPTDQQWQRKLRDRSWRGVRTKSWTAK